MVKILKKRNAPTKGLTREEQAKVDAVKDFKDVFPAPMPEPLIKRKTKNEEN